MRKAIPLVVLFLMLCISETIAQQIVPFHMMGSQSPLVYTNAKAGSALREFVDDRKLVKNIFKGDSVFRAKNPVNEHVFFFGDAQASSSENFGESLSASGKFQVLAIPHPKWAFTLSYNRVGITPSSVPRDSIDLNNVIFPDAGNTGFMFSLAFRPWLIRTRASGPILDQRYHSFRLGPYIECAMRHVKFDLIDSTSSGIDSLEVIKVYDNKSFTALNYNIGAKLEYYYTSGKDSSLTFQFVINPYIHICNIPNEDAVNFSYVLNKTPNPNALGASYIGALGIKVSASFKGFTVFGDFRHNGNVKGFDLSSSAIQGTVFNVGTSISTQIFKF